MERFGKIELRSSAEDLTAWALLGGPGGAPFLEKLNLALRFQRISQFLPQNAHRVDRFPLGKVKMMKILIPTIR